MGGIGNPCVKFSVADFLLYWYDWEASCFASLFSCQTVEYHQRKPWAHPRSLSKCAGECRKGPPGREILKRAAWWEILKATFWQRQSSKIDWETPGEWEWREPTGRRKCQGCQGQSGPKSTIYWKAEICNVMTIANKNKRVSPLQRFLGNCQGQSS